jgi:hypothetical protein
MSHRDVYGNEVPAQSIDDLRREILDTDWMLALDARDGLATEPLSTQEVYARVLYLLGTNAFFARQAPAHVLRSADEITAMVVAALTEARNTKHMVRVSGGKPTWYPSISWREAAE